MDVEILLLLKQAQQILLLIALHGSIVVTTSHFSIDGNYKRSCARSAHRLDKRPGLVLTSGCKTPKNRVKLHTQKKSRAKLPGERTNAHAQASY